jgi:hypothetical protein
MKKGFAVIALFFLVINSGAVAEETSFTNCKLPDIKGKQADATLTFSDKSQNMSVRVADRDLVVIPYASLDKVSYEYSKKHRVTQGAIVMLASLGAGAVVMLTKSKSHWLYVDYHEQNIPKSIVLRMDKSNYQRIFEAVKSHTGKDVEFMGDAAKNKPAKTSHDAAQAAAQAN